MTKEEYVEALHKFVHVAEGLIDAQEEAPTEVLSSAVALARLKFEIVKELYRVTGEGVEKEITFKVDGKELAREVLNDNLS